MNNVVNKLKNFNIFSSKNVPVPVDNGDQAKALERTLEHYKLFKKDSNELSNAITSAGFNTGSTEYTDYMNYFDQMNKAYVKTALDTFVYPSFDKNEMTNYVKSDSEPLGKTKIDPTKYYEIHSAVVSKSGSEDLKNALQTFKDEVRKKNPNTTEFDKIDEKYPIMVDNKVVAVKNSPPQVVENISNNLPLNQKEKDNILAIAAVHQYIKKK